MTGLRARVRAELTAEIKRLARDQVEQHGAAALSLRAIARDLGMASSAIYRYYPSRDDLLTALLVDAYNELGAGAEAADAGVAADDPRARFVAVAGAAYAWARAHPSQYSLLFGTPVPGYAAPPDTVGPATRFTLVLIGVMGEVARQGHRPTVEPTVPASVAPDLMAVRDGTGVEVDDALMLAGMQVWTALFGVISFIVFGQFQNVVGDVDAMFDAVAHVLADQVMGGASAP
jgi:AcrR family transcriptional regulator